MSSAKRNVGVESGQVELPASNFFDNIGPGGRYFRYTSIVVAILALTFLTLLTLLLLPYLTGGQFQNPVSHLFGNVPIQNQKPKASAPPRITYPLPTGIQSWKFSRASEVKGPSISLATVDPLTPGKGQPQVVTLLITNDTPVTKATATIFTDNQSLEHDLKLVSGSPTNGTWATSWNMTDTYDNIYHIDFELDSSSGNWTGALTFR